MQITDFLVDLKSYISQWAYFRSWPQVLWAGPCSPHVGTMWKNYAQRLSHKANPCTSPCTHTRLHTLKCKGAYTDRSVMCNTHSQAYTNAGYRHIVCLPMVHEIQTHTDGHISLCRVWVAVGPHRAAVDHMPVMNMNEIMHEPSLWHDSFIHVVQSLTLTRTHTQTHTHTRVAWAHAHKHWLCLSLPCY